MNKFYLPKIVADVPPAVAAGVLRNSLKKKRQKRKPNMRTDPMRRPVIHWPHLQYALHVTPGSLHSNQLLVSESHVLGTERVIIAVHYELAVIPGGSLHRSLVDSEAAVFKHPQIPAIPSARAQSTRTLAVLLARGAVRKRRKLRLQLLQHLLPVPATPGFLLGVVTHHVSASSLPIAYHQPAPQPLQHVYRTVGPGVDDLPARVVCDDLLRRAAPQYAPCQPPQALLYPWIIGPTKGVDYLVYSPVLAFVPLADGKLEVSDGRAVLVLSGGFSKEHVTSASTSDSALSREISAFVLLGFSARVSTPGELNPLKPLTSPSRKWSIM